MMRTRIRLWNAMLCPHLFQCFVRRMRLSTMKRLLFVVETHTEWTYNNYQDLVIDERCSQTESTESVALMGNLSRIERCSQGESTESAVLMGNPSRNEDFLLLEATGGTYKGRVYGMGNQPSRPCSTYDASSSTFVSQQ